MSQRIQKIVAASGLTSRRKAEELIQRGRVTCNGRICALGDTADPGTDVILVDGMPLPEAGKRVYIMLHKPRGYVTTLSDEKGRPDAAQLVRDCGCRVYPVGRLDMDSEGLLLFTNDGEFANRLMHPSHNVDKVYRVAVKGFSEQALERLKEPVELDGYKIRAPKVEVLHKTKEDQKTAQLLVTIHEGRNRQVRRMCAMAGMDVARLVRVQEGSVQLGDLPRGKWRYLRPDEIAALSK